MAEKLDRTAAMLYFLSGLALGSVVTVLFVPQSGDETRAYLSQKARHASGYAQRKAQEIQERTETLLEQGKKTIRGKKHQLSSAINAFRRSAA